MLYSLSASETYVNQLKVLVPSKGYHYESLSESKG
jgi:hypothetical protein